MNIKEKTKEAAPVTLADKKPVGRGGARKRKVKTVIDRIFGFFLATGIVVGVACLGLEYVIVKGPSPALCETFVMTMLETRRFGFIPNIFLSEEEVAAIKNDARKRRAAGHGPDAHLAVGAGTAHDGFDLGMDAARDFFGGKFGEVAVFGAVEGMEEALGDVGVGLAEVDVEDVGGHVARDGEEGAFDAFDLDAGGAVEADGERG